MSLRVAYLVRRYPLLSQTFVRNEVDEARRQGLDLVVCSLEQGDQLAGGAAPDLLVDGRWSDDELAQAARAHRRRHPLRWRRFRRTCDVLASELGRGPGKVDHRTIPALATELEERGVDVLHAHFGWQGAVAAWLLSTLLERPWSMTLHANDIFAMPRHLEAKLAAADRVVTVCDYNLRWMRDHLGLERPVDVVVCGVEVPSLPVAAAGAEPAVDVLAVGRLVEKKGFDLLLRAAAELHRTARPDLSVEIVGEGPLEDELTSLRDELGIGDVVRFQGALAHDEVLERMGQARVFCLPCRVASDGDRDSMPVVIKEAMARAVPVVATAEVAVPEMVDERCGRLVPPEDPIALAGALGELLADPSLAATLGQAGRQRVEERFTLEGEVAKLLRVFEEMAGAPALAVGAR